MNRLTDIYLGNTHSQIVYDPLGRMTSKQADGQSVFANASFAGLPGQPVRPHAMKSAETADGVFPTASQTITYSSFDKVKSIAKGGNTLAYTYGFDQQRIRMVEETDGLTRTKDYVGMCEYITEDDGENTSEKTLTYLVGPYGVFAVVEQQDNEESMHYILKDHLGSWTTITDSEGNVEQELSFDAWGNMRDPETWCVDASMRPMFDRGYTGHEHLNGFGLINMNGRMYDPVMSSFLSVDNYVQVPDFSQSFNRYAYCLNNPLSYTDPSGEIVWFVPVIIGAAIGAYTGASIQSGTAAFWNWKPDAWKGAIAGAIVGGTLGYGFAGAIGATGMTTITANGTIAVTKSAGLVSSMLNSGTVNITMNALSGGGWDGAWKAGVVGLATGCWNTSGGFGMVKGFGTTSDIGKLAGKLGYQMIGTAGGSIGNNWARGEDPFSKVTLGVGPINLTLGKKQMPFQLKNNWENIITNVLGLGNLAFGGKVNFDWKNLSLNYYGGLVDKMFPTTLYENGIIYDQYSGFGAHSVIGNSNLFNADYDIYSHELHHLWQSRAFGNAFVFNYVLQGIEAMSMGGSFLEIYNYFEDIANRRFWW